MARGKSTAETISPHRGDKRRITRDKRGRIRTSETISRGPSKSRANLGQPWSTQELRELRKLIQENTPTRVIGLKLGRTPTAIQGKARREGLSLRPVNRSPRKPKRR